MMQPLVDRLRDDYAGRCKIIDLNIDRNQQTAQQYNIGNVPTFVLFVNGREGERRTGALTENQIRSMIESAQTKLSKRRFITIVSGLPRSGTSMMMKAIEAGGIPTLTDGIRAADEDNPNGYFEFEPVKRTADDPTWLNGAEGKAVKLVYSLLKDLPEDRCYRVLFLRRNLQEVLMSQRIMLERKGNDANGISDERIAELFRRELDSFEEWIGKHPAFSILDLNYNTLIRDPEPDMARISEFLGGGLDTREMIKVVDPAMYRQRVA
jgi:hypothetical protein